MIWIIALALKLSPAQANTGFQNGNELEVTPMQGVAHVTCYDDFNRRVYRTFSCYQEYVEPDLVDYFVSQIDFEANKVDLECTQASGKVVNKSSGFDNEKQRSSKRFNLWINTLLQKPLLGPGTNQVDYMISGDSQIESGSFAVEVNVAPTVNCGSRNLTYHYSCNNRMRICDDFFYFSRCAP